MPSYTGRTPRYGLFEKQSFVGDNTQQIFTLTYSVGNSSALLVVKNGLVLEPDVDYSIASAGSEIDFSVAPLVTDNIFAIYMGKQLLTP